MTAADLLSPQKDNVRIPLESPFAQTADHVTAPTPTSPTTTPTATGQQQDPQRRSPRTQRQLIRSRKAEFVATSESTYNAHSVPDNIHKEALPPYIPADIADNVEMCYMKREQCGWVPLLNVDPNYDYQKDHASFPMWWETSEAAGERYNPEGEERFRNSPRLVNYRKRHGETAILPLNINEKNKYSGNEREGDPNGCPTYDDIDIVIKRPDPLLSTTMTAQSLNNNTYSSHLCAQKQQRPIPDKITNIDGPVGREGWRSYANLGNGVVRWTDDIFDWRLATDIQKRPAKQNYNETGPLTEPMYSSFSNDKVFRWSAKKGIKKGTSDHSNQTSNKGNSVQGTRRREKKPNLAEIVKRSDMRRQKAEIFGFEKGAMTAETAVEAEFSGIVDTTTTVTPTKNTPERKIFVKGSPTAVVKVPAPVPPPGRMPATKSTFFSPIRMRTKGRKKEVAFDGVTI